MLSWPYIAGFFDGEGNICVYARNRGLSGGMPKASLCQTGRRGLNLLTAISNFLLAAGIPSNIYTISTAKYNPRATTCYSLCITGTDNVCTFAKRIIPYLHIKKAEAQDVVRYMSIYVPMDRAPKAWSMLMREAVNTPERRANRARAAKIRWGSV